MNLYVHYTRMLASSIRLKPKPVCIKNIGLIVVERKSDTHRLISKWLKEDLHRKSL